MSDVEIYALELLVRSYQDKQQRESSNAERRRKDRDAMQEYGDDALADGVTLHDYSNAVDEIAWSRGMQAAFGIVVRDLEGFIKAAKNDG